MPGQPWPSLALILASTCCLPEDVKRNLPVLLLQTWKLALMEGSVRWNRVFCLAHRSEVKCKYILPNSDLIFHPPFPHFWNSESNEHLICSHHIWMAINMCCKGSVKGCAAPAPCVLIPVLHVSSTAQQQPGSSMLPGTKPLGYECWGGSLCCLCSILSLHHWGCQVY